MHNNYSYRKDYTKAKEQLQKGRAFLNHSMNTMGVTPWNYVGVVCFPNLENRQALQDAGSVNDEDELKVLIKTIHSIKFIVYL